MFRHIWSVLAAAFFVLGLSAASGELQAQQVKASCARDGHDLVCDVRSGQVKQVRDVTVSVNGKQSDRASYESFERSNRTAAWYFLIQQTAHPHDSAQIIDRIMDQAPTRRIFVGVGTFGEKFEEKLSLGASAGQIARLKDDLRKSGDTRTDLFRSALDAVEKLTATGVKADRKALVIFADGRSDFGQSGRERLIKALNENNIFLYTVTMAGKGDVKANPRELKDLAAETNGVSLTASDCEKGPKKQCLDLDLDDGTVRDFPLYLESGGQVRLPASSVSKSSDLSFEVTFADGKTAESKAVFSDDLGSQPIASDTHRSSCPNGDCRPQPAAWWEDAKDWVMDNPVIAGGGAAVFLGILILLVTLLSGRKAAVGPAGETQLNPNAYPMTTITAGETVILTNLKSNPDQTYAWLQFLDADARRLPIGSTNVRIGRHKDNDIILQNKTVHRQHAVLHMTPDRHFSINDLGGANGTLVNGQRCSKCDLHDGDLIELGEVRVRFFSNSL